MSLGSSLSGFRLREFSRSVQAFFVYGALINAGMALFMLLYNLYLLRLSYQEDFIGQLASMAPLATGLVALPTGVLSDRFGRKPFLIASGLLIGLSQLGLCFATSSAALLGFSFCVGVGSAFIWVNHVPFLSDNAHPSRRVEAIVIWSALQIVVRMLLSLAGGFLPGLMASIVDASTEMPAPFRYSLVLGAAMSLVSIVPLLRIPNRRHREPPKEGEPTREPAEAPQIRPWRAFGAITALNATRGFSMGLTYPFFNVFFEEQLQIGPALIGVAFFLSQLVSLPATLSAPSLMRRFGASLTIMVARATGGGAVGVMGAVATLPVAIPMFLLIRIGEVIDNPSDQHFSSQILPRRYLARVQGFRVCGFQILAFLGSLIGGKLILDYGYGVTFGLACVSRVVSGLIMALFFGVRRQPAGPA